jgi:hypothetical protein
MCAGKGARHATAASRRSSASLPHIALGVSSPASAGALNLRWNECWGDGGVQNRVFACDRNTGSEVLVASFVPRFDFPQMTADEFVVDLRHRRHAARAVVVVPGCPATAG